MIRALLMLMCLPLHATVYYVDVGAGNNANNGTATNTAWASLPGTVGATGAGWVTLVNGDTAYVKGGTTNNVQVKYVSASYSGSNTFDSIQVVSGHLRSPAWGNTQAIFDGQNTRTFGFWIASGNGLTIDGFEIRNIQSGGVGIGFDPTSGSCCVAIGGAGTVLSCKVRRCYLHDAIRGATDCGHGIETDGSSGSTNLVVEFNTIGPNIGTKGIEIQTYDYGAIRNNFLTDSGDHGIVITGNRWDVYNNMVYMVPPYAHEPVFGIKVNFNRNDVWNNLVYQAIQTTGSASNNMEGIGTLDNASSNRFYFNTVINASDLNGNRTGAAFSMADENVAGTNNEVQACILAFSKNNVGNLWNTVQMYLGTPARGSIVKFNNLFGIVPTDSVIAYNNGVDYTFYTVAAATSASPIGSANVFANNVQVYPGFAGGILPTGLNSLNQPNTGYFALSPDTPQSVRVTTVSVSGDAIHGYSSVVGKFNTDIVGVTRVNKSMGAYEFPASGTPVPLPLRLKIAIIGH